MGPLWCLVVPLGIQPKCRFMDPQFFGTPPAYYKRGGDHGRVGIGRYDMEATDWLNFDSAANDHCKTYRDTGLH